MTPHKRILIKSMGIFLILAVFASSTWAQPPSRRPSRPDSKRQGRRPRRPDNLKVGDVAPDFKLKSPNGKKEIKLSDYKGKKPVALVFGSYTWPPFRRQVGDLDKMYATYGKEVAFFMVYIREAHPTDGRQSRANEREKILIKQPKTLKERNQIAKKMCSTLKISLPPIVDSIDNKVNNAYNAAPDRLYLIGKDGKILYKSERGPRGFKSKDLETAIKKIADKK